MQHLTRRVARLAAVAVTTAAFAVPLAATGQAGATSGPTLTPSANDNLRGGQVITLDGTGYDPSTSVAIIQCTTATPDMQDPSADCDTSTVVVTPSDASGDFSNVSFTLTSGAVGTSGATCPSQTAAGPCYLIAAEPSNPAVGTAAPITFAPIVTVTPSTDVKNGQKLSVSGYGFPAKAETAYVVECANPPGQSTCNADSVQQPTTTAQGTFSNVQVTVVTGTWGGKSCVAGGACLITATTDITATQPDTSGAAVFTFAKQQVVTKAKTTIFANGKVAHGKVRLSGVIEAGNRGVQGLKLKVYDRRKGSKKWHWVKRAKSGKNGVFAIAGLKHFKHAEQYRVTHPSQRVGDTVYKASTSRTVTVK